MNLRFAESTRYDVISDAEVVRLMAITPQGTYHVEVVLEPGQPLRTRRESFKEKVFELIDAGEPPCEVSL